ncbi:MAG: DNA primase [Acidobacteriota bacterium]
MAVRLTPDVVQAVRDAVDVVDIASELTSLKRRGRKYQGLCPFHKEKTPSFHVDPDLGLYHCFGCGVGGDAIDLFMRGSGDDFPGAVEALAQRYAIPLEYAADGAQARQRRDVAAALESAEQFFRRALRQAPGPRAYLDRRQVSSELTDGFALGFAPDEWHALHQSLGRTIDDSVLLDAGLLGRSEKSGRLYDRFRNRLIFPIHAASGKLVGFGGRTLGDDRAKYINTAETAAFRKGELLYGLHRAKRTLRDTGRAVLAEGYMDVIGLAACGLDGAVAGMGTALTAEQAKLLARYSDEVVLAYDGDEAGLAAARKALPLLLAAGLSVRRASFPAGHDPDSLRLEHGPDAVVERIEDAEDALWLEIEHLSGDGRLEPHEQSRAAGAVRELLAPMRDAVRRAAYGRRAAQRLGVPEGAVLSRQGAELYGRAVTRSRTDVRTEEEKAIALLLGARDAVEHAAPPPPERLPPEEIFLDAECRNIYAAFCAMYRSGRSIPAPDSVISHLADQGLAVDRAAAILLQDSTPDETTATLQDTLGMLETRWRKRRLTEIRQEIRRAEHDGDLSRLNELLEEKTLLSRHLHPTMTGRLW